MDIKQLKSILKVLRDNGVSNFRTPELELTLTQDALLPKKTSTNSQIEVEEPVDDPWKDFPDGTLTPSQLAFYSSGGSPSDDPENM